MTTADVNFVGIASWKEESKRVNELATRWSSGSEEACLNGRSTDAADLKRFVDDRWPSLERRRAPGAAATSRVPTEPGFFVFVRPAAWPIFFSGDEPVYRGTRSPRRLVFYFLGMRAPSVQQLKHCCLAKINELEVESAGREANGERKIDEDSRVTHLAQRLPSRTLQTACKRIWFRDNLIGYYAIDHSRFYSYTKIGRFFNSSVWSLSKSLVLVRFNFSRFGRFTLVLKLHFATERRSR